MDIDRIKKAVLFRGNWVDLKKFVPDLEIINESGAHMWYRVSLVDYNIKEQFWRDEQEDCIGITVNALREQEVIVYIHAYFDANVRKQYCCIYH